MSEASKVVQDKDVSQVVLTVSLPAPSVVAGHAETTPNRAPLVPCLVGLGTTLGGLAATVLPTDCSPPSRLFFESPLFTLRLLKSSGGPMPDIFLVSLQGKVVFLHEHPFAISGNLIADSFTSFCACIIDPLTPSLARPRMGIVSYHLFVAWWVCPPRPLSQSLALRSQLGFLVLCLLSLTPPPGFACLPSVPPSLPVPPTMSSVPVLSPFFWSCSSSSSAFVVRLSSSFSLSCRSSSAFFCCSCHFSSFISPSSLPTHSCPSWFSLFAYWSSFSFGSFRGLLLFLFFDLFSPLFGSSCSFLFFPFGSIVVCRFFLSLSAPHVVCSGSLAPTLLVSPFVCVTLSLPLLRLLFLLSLPLLRLLFLLSLPLLRLLFLLSLLLCLLLLRCSFLFRTYGSSSFS